MKRCVAVVTDWKVVDIPDEGTIGDVVRAATGEDVPEGVEVWTGSETNADLNSAIDEEEIVLVLTKLPDDEEDTDATKTVAEGGDETPA